MRLLKEHPKLTQPSERRHQRQQPVERDEHLSFAYVYVYCFSPCICVSAGDPGERVVGAWTVRLAVQVVVSLRALVFDVGVGVATDEARRMQCRWQDENEVKGPWR